MRLLRIGPVGHERPYVMVSDGAVVPVADVVDDFRGESLSPRSLSRLERVAVERESTPMTDLGHRVGAPVAQPQKIICIGLNYHDHARETGQPVPTEPIVFLKAPNTLVGPSDAVRIPRGSVKTDWEVELSVVIGQTCRYLESPRQALDAVAGYMVSNDVSEREFQLERGGQWVKGKSCETFNPAGPWLVTPDEIADPGGLGLWLTVNGERRQTGNTADMVFGVADIIMYLSQFMVLDPGDIINTGTPAGVALGMADPQYLRPGDVMELGIERLGSQRQVCLAAEGDCENGDTRIEGQL